VYACFTFNAPSIAWSTVPTAICAAK
jgi:hypothetical protein